MNSIFIFKIVLCVSNKLINIYRSKKPVNNGINDLTNAVFYLLVTIFTL